MELILRETIDTLGEVGDVVKVKPGYGRNYLLPQGKAVLANKSNLAILTKQQAAINAHKAEQRKGAEQLAARLGAAKVVIAQRTGEDGKLYGSVTSADIIAILKEQGIEADKRKLMMDEPIKALGTHLLTYKAGYQVTAELKVEVISQDAEPAAETPAEA